MPNGTHAAPQSGWFVPGSRSTAQPDKAEHRSAVVLERGLLGVAAAALCLVGFASRLEDVGKFTSLIIGSFADLPEYGALLFFGSALIGLGIWARRRSR